MQQGTRYIPLETRDYVSGGNYNFSLKSLPSLTKVKRFMLDIKMTLAKSDAGDGTVEWEDLPAIIDIWRLDRWRNLKGLDWDRFHYATKGRYLENRADVTVPGQSSITVYFALEMPMELMFLMDPQDTSFPAEMLKNKSLEVYFALNTVFGGTITISAAEIKASAEVVHTTPGWCPMLSQIGYQDIAGRTIPADGPAAYHSAFLTKPVVGSGRNFVAGEVDTVQVNFDGEATSPTHTDEQAITRWNVLNAVDTRTDGLARLGMVLPLVTEGRRDQLVSKVPYCESGVNFQLEGTISAPHIVWCRAIPKGVSQIREIGANTGVNTSTAVYTSKVGRKGALKAAANTPKAARMFALLPGRWREGDTARRTQMAKASPDITGPR